MSEKPIKAAKNITLDGYEVLGKMVKSGGGRRQSATVSEKAKGCFFFLECGEHMLWNSVSSMFLEGFSASHGRMTIICAVSCIDCCAAL